MIKKLSGINKDGIEERCWRTIDKAKLVWDFKFHLQKSTTARRPDLILGLKVDKNIWICDVACPQQNNIDNKSHSRRENDVQITKCILSQL